MNLKTITTTFYIIQALAMVLMWVCLGGLAILIDAEEITASVSLIVGTAGFFFVVMGMEVLRHFIVDGLRKTVLVVD